MGSVVGGFRVETPLDRGGMGVVYRAALGLVLIGSADRELEDLEMDMPPFESEWRDDVLRSGEAALGTAACREALDRGRAMAIDEVVSLALGRSID